MAQELKSINLLAPAFKGVNTEDSPLAQDPSFAEIADNAVIDKRGRIAARKGYTLTTTSATPLGNNAIRAVHEFEDNQGNTEILSVGNNKILNIFLSKESRAFSLRRFFCSKALKCFRCCWDYRKVR